MDLIHILVQTVSIINMDTVYITELSNDDGVVAIKAGWTDHPIEKRMQQLNNEFNNRFNVKLVMKKRMHKARVVEKALHRAFVDSRKVVFKKFGNSRECYNTSAKAEMMMFVDKYYDWVEDLLKLE